MARWEPDSRGRLEQAAMELFAERGYDQTTVAEIAERAGVTERTFFRHFADKREVLFGGAADFLRTFVEPVAGAPDSATPMEAVAAGLDAAGAFLQGRRAFALRRQRLIAAHTELQERELIKLASLASQLAETLRRRGIADPAASLAAEAGVAVFRIAFERWIAERAKRALPDVIREHLAQLRAVAADGAVAGVPVAR